MEKKYKSLILIGVIGIILALISATYAYWMITKTQTGSNIISSKCLDISITGETNDINLVDAYPITDEEGESTVPYTFTITNNCNSAVDYQVTLESIGNASESLQPSSIKVKFDNKNSRTLDKYRNINTTVEGAYSSHRLTTGTLAAAGEEGSSKTYNVRLWIDEAVTIEENGKNYEGKISVSIGDNIKNIICEGVTSGTLTTGNIPQGEYNYGDEYICTLGGEEYHFFLLEDGDNTELIKGDTGTAGPGEVSLIMDRNIGDTVAWCNKEDYIDGGGTEADWNAGKRNNYGPRTANKYLANQTSDWEITPYIPTYEQVFNSNGGKTNMYSLQKWLRGSGQIAYWTDYGHSEENLAWCVDVNSWIRPDSVTGGGGFKPGVRPVITISKANID